MQVTMMMRRAMVGLASCFSLLMKLALSSSIWYSLCSLWAAVWGVLTSAGAA
jgi:hypothetical protein